MPSRGSIVTGLTVLAYTSSISAFVAHKDKFFSRPPTNIMSSERSDSKNDDEPVAGSFFNIVPSQSDSSNAIPDENEEIISNIASDLSSASVEDEVDMFKEIIQNTKLSRDKSGQGFAKTTTTSEHVSISNIQTTSTDSKGKQQSFVGIGKPLNDIQNPEYDEQGYTLYADETTGEKKRVFEALVEYPSIFKMKIVGQDDESESFAPEIIEVVAESCGVEYTKIKHSKRQNGKWTSVTVHAPVESADMLYSLYENVDKNPRVKFKF